MQSRTRQPQARRPVTTNYRPVSSRLRALRRDPRSFVLVLRAYLGITFLYAGLSKVGGSFLDSSSPTSMHGTLLAVRGQSPIGGLLGPVAHHSFAFGLLMAIGETAVGLGVLSGLFTRIAALGGMVISLSLFLTVSWNATPWYTGADIVYLFALTPLLLGGAGPLSADEWLAAQRDRNVGPDARAEDITRRVVIGGLAAIGGLIAVGMASLFRNKSSGAPSTVAGPNSAPTTTQTAGRSPGPSTSTSAGAAGGPAILAAASVPVGGAAEATDPQTGDPIYVLQLQAGVYTALDRICPHQGCEVAFISASAGFECPCHLSTFDPSGAVTQGPAASNLAKVPIAKSGSQIVRA